jgi:phosphate transport system permease protein
MVLKGFPALSWDFFTKLPAPVGEEGGGLGNAALGSLLLVAGGALFGLPTGLTIGVYLSEYRQEKFAHVVRLSMDLLSGVPSIVLGIFAYGLWVVPMKSFSGIAGSFTLGVVMVPMVARTTEEMLKLVPSYVREAGLALGLPRYRVILSILLRAARSAIATGGVLALARVAGESAPLLLTALGSSYWPRSIWEPVASLPVQIYLYASSPYDEWHRLAWAGAFVLVLGVVIANLTTRLLLSRGSGL